MRAKMSVTDIVTPYPTEVIVYMAPVSGKPPFGPNGESEDNTYARYTPSGSLSLTITNPDLLNVFKLGQTFYLDFTEHIE